MKDFFPESLGQKHVHYTQENMVYMDSKEQNKQTKQKQTHRYREPTNGCQMRGGLGAGWKRWSYQAIQISGYKIVMGM